MQSFGVAHMNGCYQGGERVRCQKVVHDSRSGYLHEADDDNPYDVDGVAYCGRCHIALPHPGVRSPFVMNGISGDDFPERAPQPERETPPGRVPREHMEEELADWTLIPRDRFTSLPYEALDFMHTVACSARMSVTEVAATSVELEPSLAAAAIVLIAEAAKEFPDLEWKAVRSDFKAFALLRASQRGMTQAASALAAIEASNTEPPHTPDASVPETAQP